MDGQQYDRTKIDDFEPKVDSTQLGDVHCRSMNLPMDFVDERKIQKMAIGEDCRHCANSKAIDGDRQWPPMYSQSFNNKRIK